MQHYLLDKSNLTDLTVRHDEEVLSNLYRDVKIEQYLVQDLILKLDLERLSHNFHTQFDISLNKLRSFHSNHQNLLLEFQSAFEHDLTQITSCVRSKHFVSNNTKICIVQRIVICQFQTIFSSISSFCHTLNWKFTTRPASTHSQDTFQF